MEWIAKEVDRSPRRQNQVVVGNLAALGQDDLAGEIHPVHARHHELEVLLPLENRPHGVGAISCGEMARRCHLVEQRLKQVIIAFVNHRHADGFARQRARRAQTAEPGADNHHMGERFRHPVLVDTGQWPGKI